MKKTHDTAQFEQNKNVHDANVLNEYQTLEYADRPGNQAQYKTALKEFKKTYWLQLGSLSYDHLSTAPEGAINIVSFRENLTFFQLVLEIEKEADVKSRAV